MSRIDREHLIERYLRGELSPAQEERFFIEIATNQELRNELKAYRVVEETLLRDSRRHAAPQTALRARLEAQMAGMQAASASAPSAPAATSAVAEAARVPLKWFLMAVTGAGLAIGGLVVSSLSNDTHLNRAASTQAPINPAPGMVAEPRHITEETPVSAPAMTTDSATPAGTALRESTSRVEPIAVAPPQKKGSTSVQYADTTGRHTASEHQRRNDVPTALQQFRNSASGRSTSHRDTLDGSATLPVEIIAPKPMGDKR